VQSFNTKSHDPTRPEEITDNVRVITLGGISELRPGECATAELPNGDELAVYNVNGEFYATENFCPHKGAPLADGILCEHVIECGLHGWQFDVRTGNCLTVVEKLLTYEVIIEDGSIRILV